MSSSCQSAVYIGGASLQLLPPGQGRSMKTPTAIPTLIRQYFKVNRRTPHMDHSSSTARMHTSIPLAELRLNIFSVASGGAGGSIDSATGRYIAPDSGHDRYDHSDRCKWQLRQHLCHSGKREHCSRLEYPHNDSRTLYRNLPTASASKSLPRLRRHNAAKLRVQSRCRGRAVQ